MIAVLTRVRHAELVGENNCQEIIYCDHLASSPDELAYGFHADGRVVKLVEDRAEPPLLREGFELRWFKKVRQEHGWAVYEEDT